MTTVYIHRVTRIAATITVFLLDKSADENFGRKPEMTENPKMKSGDVSGIFLWVRIQPKN
jgi:hypothetical protein